MMMALDAGVEDFNADEDKVFVVTTISVDFGSVREALEEHGVEFLESLIRRISDRYTAINKEDNKKLQKMLDLLDDDIQEVYYNKNKII